MSLVFSPLPTRPLLWDIQEGWVSPHLYEDQCLCQHRYANKTLEKPTGKPP